MMKNEFYFMLKAIFVYKMFKFLSWVFGHVGKRLDKKATVNFKIYEKQIIAIHILPNISRSKGNQAMKFGQLSEYNMRNIFKPAENQAGRLVPDLFLFFKKALFEIKASNQHLSFNIYLVDVHSDIQQKQTV